MNICVICVEKDDYAPKRIIEAGINRGHSMYLTSWMNLTINIENRNIYIGDDARSLSEFDAIITRSPNFTVRKNRAKIKKNLETLLRLIIVSSAERGIPVLNDNFFLKYQSLDKLAQQFFFSKNNLPGIPTYYFSHPETLPQKKDHPFPCIVKLAQGSLGKGVFKAMNLKNLQNLIQKSNVTGKPLIFQKYFKIKWDYRVLVIGGKALGVMKRTAKKGEWRTNFSLGGIVAPANGKNIHNIKKLAEITAQKMELDYVGVDILESEKKIHLIEVNPLAQFGGFEKAFKDINVAEKIIQLIEQRIHKIKK